MTDEADHAACVVYFVVDAASYSGCGEGAVVRHPDSPSLGEVDDGLRRERGQLDTAARTEPVLGGHGEHDRLAR